VSDSWVPGFTRDDFAVTIDENIVSELNSLASWPGLAIVNDHTFEGQVSGVNWIFCSKNTSVCGGFTGLLSDRSDFPSVLLFVNLDHCTVDNITCLNVNSLTAMGSTVSINEIRSEMPFMPKERVVKTPTLTKLHNWLKDETTCTVNTSTVLKTVEDINTGETSRSILLRVCRNCPFGAHG